MQHANMQQWKFKLKKKKCVHWTQCKFKKFVLTQYIDVLVYPSTQKTKEGTDCYEKPLYVVVNVHEIVKEEYFAFNN